MVGKAFFKGWAIGVAPFTTYMNSHFLPIYFQIAHWSWEETTRLDETILVERIWVKTMSGTSNGLMGHCVQTY